MSKTPFKILLYIPPVYERALPPLGTPALISFLKSKGVAAFQEDLNIKFFEYAKINNLEFIFTEKYKNDKIKNRVYYYQDLKYGNCPDYLPKKVIGATFDFTEKLLSSENLFRFIDDETENIFHKFFRYQVLSRIKKEKFTMVGFSITAPSQAIPAFTFGRIIKRELPNIRVVIGGQWVSFFKEELIKRNDFCAFYDYVIYSDGETPLYLLIDSIKKNKSLSEIPNLIYRKENKFILSKNSSEEDINKIPCPDFDGLPLKKYSSYKTGESCPLTFMTAKGCYWNRCIFCIDLPFPKPRYQERNIELLIEDIKTLKRKYNVGEVRISNPLFSPWQMERFCKELLKQKIKIKWWAWMRFEEELTKDLLVLAKKAGCVSLDLGLESMSQRVLDFCDKGIRTEIIKRIASDTRDVKLKIFYQVIFGLPSETTQDAMETISFLVNYPREVVFNIYCLTPKNRLYNNPSKYGIELKKCQKLPFRFFYPFRNTLGNIKLNQALKIINFYNFFYNQNDEITSQISPKLSLASLKKLNFSNIIKIGELILLGSRYEKLRRYSKANEVFKKLLKKFPNSGKIYMQLAKNYFKLKKYEEAIKSLKKSRELDYKEDNLHFLLGYCYKELKRHKQAITELKKAERMNQTVPEINFSLSECYRNINQIERSNKELDKGFLKLKKMATQPVS